MESNKPYIQSEILNAILKGGQEEEKAALRLFEEYRGFIVRQGLKTNLAREDLEDAYSDSLVKVVRAIKRSKFRGESKLSTYFYSVYNNTCIDVLRKKSSNKNSAPVRVELNEKHGLTTDLVHLLDIQEEFEQLSGSLGDLGEPCKGVLMDWGYHGYSMDEIALKRGLANAHSARTIKYNCIKKLRERIKK